MHKPRVSMHPDGQYISIGFDHAPDTLLKVGGQPGRAGEADVARARLWVDAVNAILSKPQPDIDWAAPWEDHREAKRRGRSQ